MNTKRVIETLAVLSVILNSGGNSIVRSIFLLVITALLLLITHKKFKRIDLRISILFILYFTLNSLIFNSSTFIAQDFFVLVARVLCCSIIASNIDSKRFYSIYIRIIVVLCCMSLFWFALLCVDIYPPFLKRELGVYSSVFQTVGFKLSSRRNCGIFSEPGLFQMHINLAFIILCYFKELAIKKKSLVIMLFVVTVLTTKSAMGYLCLLISSISFFMTNDKMRTVFGDRSKRNIFIVLLGICAIVLELNLHTIQNFIISWESYSSRHDDTILGLLIAKDYPVFGIGLANDNDMIWKSYFNVLGSASLYDPNGMGYLSDLASSNGLINCIYQGGILFATIYFLSILKSFFYDFKIQRMVERVFIFLFFCFIFCGEPYMLTPIFILISFYGSHIGSTVKQGRIKIK